MKKKLVFLFLFSICQFGFAQSSNTSISLQTKKDLKVLQQKMVTVNDVQLKRIEMILVAHEEIVLRNTEALKNNPAELKEMLLKLHLQKINQVKSTLDIKQIKEFDENHLAEML